jgi:hypothetical protein
MDDRELVELLLAHGARPNAYLDSGGTAIGWASTELRPLMIAHGGKLDPTDDEILKRVKEDQNRDIHNQPFERAMRAASTRLFAPSLLIASDR